MKLPIPTAKEIAALGGSDNATVERSRMMAARLNDVLSAANGVARQHVYRDAFEIVQLAARAEAQLAQLLGGTSKFRGAIYTATSGDPVSNSYANKGHTRVATRVVLLRGASRWYLVACERENVWRRGGGEMLTLTAAQDLHAVARLRSCYIVGDLGMPQGYYPPDPPPHDAATATGTYDPEGA